MSPPVPLSPSTNHLCISSAAITLPLFANSFAPSTNHAPRLYQCRWSPLVGLGLVRLLASSNSFLPNHMLDLYRCSWSLSIGLGLIRVSPLSSNSCVCNTRTLSCFHTLALFQCDTTPFLALLSTFFRFSQAHRPPPHQQSLIMHKFFCFTHKFPISMCSI